MRPLWYLCLTSPSVSYLALRPVDPVDPLRPHAVFFDGLTTLLHNRWKLNVVSDHLLGEVDSEGGPASVGDVNTRRAGRVSMTMGTGEGFLAMRREGG